MTTSTTITTPTSTRSGSFVRIQAPPDAVYAFLPTSLPPAPPLRFDPALENLLARANQALGRLDAITVLLPEPGQFLYSYIRKEAVLSAQIEGTQSSLSDLLLFEQDATPGALRSDVREISNYVRAMDWGLERIRAGNPITNRLVKEVHDLLVRGTRGGQMDPGRFRVIQNRIGGTRLENARYIPPPAQEVVKLMGDLEGFVNMEPTTAPPVLIKAALAHAQFETIHPFLDGNGRTGRLLVPLMLCADGVLREPLLYLSLYLKTHRDEYYERLQRVRTHGEWEEWLGFFLEGVVDVARGATDTTKTIRAMIERHKLAIGELGRAAPTALIVHDYAIQSIFVQVPVANRTLNLSEPTIRNAISHLVDLGVLREVTGRRRGRVFVYGEYLEILAEGTEPL